MPIWYMDHLHGLFQAQQSRRTMAERFWLCLGKSKDGAVGKLRGLNAGRFVVHKAPSPYFAELTMVDERGELFSKFIRSNERGMPW